MAHGMRSRGARRDILDAQKQEQQQIAKTIIAPMGGGGRVAAMTGAKHIVVFDRTENRQGGMQMQFPNRLPGVRERDGSVPDPVILGFNPGRDA